MMPSACAHPPTSPVGSFLVAPGGIHIHAGTDCNSDARGHYYTGSVTTDPWTNVVYRANGNSASGSSTVNTGATNQEVTGKAMIIHNYAGGRIACAILRAAPGAGTGGGGGATPGTPITAQNFVYAALSASLGALHPERTWRVPVPRVLSRRSDSLGRIDSIRTPGPTSTMPAGCDRPVP